MEILEKIKGQIAEFDEKRKALLSELKNEFTPMIKPLFEKHPKIKSVKWNQYTPYFNDGDECTFSTNIYHMDVNGEDEDDNEALDWRIKYYLKGDDEYKNLLTENPKADIELYHGVEEFKALLNSIPDDFYKDLFGDHVSVEITADGIIEVEEYEHD